MSDDWFARRTHRWQEAGTLTIKNSILAGNTAQQAGFEDSDFNSNAITTNGYNLFGSGTGNPTGGTQDQTITPSSLFTTVLGPLAYYGGTTQTHTLLAGSPAIDKGSAHTGITVDQRNKTRPIDQPGVSSAPGGNGSDIGAFEAQICAAVSIAPTSLADIPIGSAYSQTFMGSNGTAPYTFAVTSGTLPTGLTLTLAGVLSGTPTALGTYNFTITMSDDNGCVNSQAYTANVVCPTITIDPTSLPNAVQGSSYSQTLTATGGTGTIMWSSTGTLPGGLTLNSSGVLSGTLNASGTFTFTITATRQYGCAGSREYTVIISPCVSSFTVNNLGDGADATPGNGVCETATGNGQCTLRAAIQEANALPSCAPHTITLGSGTIDLATALPDLNANMTINGPGAGSLTVRRSTAVGTPDFTVFTIASGRTVTLNGLTISNGRNTFGAGVRNNGVLTIESCVITGNTAYSLTTGFGALSRGGGIFQSGPSSSLTLSNSTVSGNQSIAETTDTNGAEAQGGGIQRGSGALTIINSTVSGNTAQSITPNATTGTARGGGLYLSSSGTLTATNATITDNSVTGGDTTNEGGGVFRDPSATGAANFKNTIIAGNNAATSPDISGTLVSQGFNLIGKSDGGAGFTDGTNNDLVGSIAAPRNALLAVLGSYGGATPTHALLPGSSAINAGTSTGAPATDQRGISRPQQSSVDIGAFESRGFSLAVSAGDNQSAPINANFASALVVSVTSANGEPVNGGQVAFTVPGGGASSTLANNPATIASGSASSGIVTANGAVGGPYTVSANANGAMAGVNFSLTNNAPNVAPTVVSITRASTSPTNATSVQFTVTFSESVTGGADSNFTLVPGGAVSGAGITGVMGSGTTRTVTVNTGTGDGTLGLNLTNSTGLTDSQGAALSNLPFTGEVYTIDKTAPDTMITVNPSNPSNSSTATFNFTGSDTGGTGVFGFECKLDSGNFTTCTSPKTYFGLTDGSHTFQVRAIDNAGNVDGLPASFTWTVDTTAPAAPVITTPANGAVTNNSLPPVSGTAEANSTVNIFFDGSVVGNTVANGSGNWSFTPSSALSNGTHTVKARSSDAAGNVSGDSNTNSFTVDTIAPDTTITANPSNPSNSASASFSFTGSDSGSGVASFECKLDSGSFTACTSSQSYTGLTDGSHTFQVRAIDNAGNVDGSPASYTWTVSLNTAPTFASVATPSRQQGSLAANSQIATVSDTQTAAGSLTVTVTSANPSNGVTISNIVNTNGTITADIIAACGAPNASFTLQVSDGSLTTTTTLNVMVTANSKPTLSYNNASVTVGNGTTVNPATGPGDNGSISSIVLQNVTPSTTPATITVNNATGVVTVPNNVPVGTYTVTIRATDNCTASTDASFTLTVNPGPLHHFAIDTISSPQTAGTAFNITITAQDANNNTVTSFTGTVNLSTTAGTISPTISGAFTNGMRTQTVTVTQAGIGKTITVDDGSGHTATSNTFTVNAGALHHFAINTINSPQVAGTAFNITLTAQDLNNNTVTGFTGTVGLSTTAGTISPTTSGAFTSGSRTENVTITQAGSGKTITANDGSGHSGTSNTFTVNAGALHHFAIGTINTQTAGTSFSLAVTAQDSNNNTVTGFTGTVNLSTTAGTISPTTSNAFTNGTLSQNVSVTQAGTGKTIMVDDGSSHTGTSNTFTVNPGALHHFAINTIAQQTTGTAFNIILTAQDANNNTVTSFTGTVGLSTTAGTISPMTSGAFTNGTRTQSVTVSQAGTGKTISVDDGGGHTGTSNTFTVIASNATPTLTAAGPLSRQKGSTATNLQIATVGDADQTANTLSVTATPLSGTGVSVSNISIAANGNVTADIATSCSATNSTFTLTVTDNQNASTTATLTVNVTTNTAPTLSYNNVSLQSGTALTNIPTIATDNGSIAYSLQSQGSYTGTLNVNPTTGVVSLSNAAPAGTHSITIRGTDNCGATKDATFTINVFNAAASGFLYALHDTNGGNNEIYGYQTDETTGALTLLAGFPLATGGQGSSTSASDYLAVDRTNLRLYALNDGSRTISAFAIDPGTGALTALPFSPIALPNGITDWKGIKVHPSGSPLLAVAGPASPGGRVASYVITSTSATAALNSPYDTGSASPFASAFSQDGNYFYTGGNSNSPFAGFSVNSVTGVLTALAGSPFSVTNTPTAFATDANGRLLMAQGADLQVFTTASGIPTGITGNPFAASLGFATPGLLHPNGYYFVVDRSNNQIRVFQIQGSGAATTLAQVSGSPYASGGVLSEAAALNQAGRFLFVAHGTSRNLTTFTVDPSSGLLSAPVTQAANTLGNAGILNGLAYVPGSILSLTPTTLPDGTVSALYSQPLTPSGGTAPYTFSVATGTLPNGLSLSSSGTLSGTPTQTGSFNFSVLVRDSLGATGGQAYSLTINCPAITITQTSLPGGTTGTSYSQNLTASGGTGPYSFSVTGGTLPPGITLNGATLSGTLTAAGTYNFTLTATDGKGCPGSQSYSVTVDCPTIDFTTTSLPNGTYNSSYTSTTLTPTGGSAPYNFTVTGLPMGMMENATTTNITLSGTPTQSGPFQVVVKVTDGYGCNNGTNGKTYALTIDKATPVLTWNHPADISYGTALSATQLNATANVPGSFTYTPSTGTVLNAGNGQTLGVSFTPTDTTNYTNATKNVTITVLKALPVITWNNPADIVYGTALSTTQLNATANVAGSFTYTPSSGTVLQAGNAQTLSATFTPSDTANYSSTMKTVAINVLKATPVITWNNPADMLAGTALSATQLNATANVAGSFAYTPGTGTVLNVGNGQTLSVLFTPTNTTNYTAANKSVTINVNAAPKTTPIITWNPPAFMAAGTALSSTELNATANVSGTFSYTPAAGTVLNVGYNQPLSVTFTPTDTMSYNTAMKAVTIHVLNTCGITVNPATLPSATYGSPYAQTLSASPTGSYKFSLLAGTLPPGLQIVNVLGIYSLRGTPSARGTYTFTIKAARNNTTCEGARTYTLTIP